MTQPPAIAVLGTASDVGKSAIAGALCRIFADRGMRVAPFKAQNMSNNAAVCADGGEIGRAQAMQARAARREPTVEMNPILLKPEADDTSQVVVLGRVCAREDARTYFASVASRGDLVVDAYRRLVADADVAVIEGAGGAAEVNLWDRDIVNWRMVEAADAAVILVANIGVGGVFAQLLGTLDLLPARWRERVVGLIVNGFRGDATLFEDGVAFLEQQSGLPVLGVVPWLPDLLLETEDGASRRVRVDDEREVDVAVIALPRLSNFTDFERLAAEPDVRLRYVREPGALMAADVVIVPGSKSTLADLAWLRARGLDAAVCDVARGGTEVVGVCGGMQMLGERIRDPASVEGGGEADALGILPVRTTMASDKTTTRSRGVATWGAVRGVAVSGYEIHVGRTERVAGPPAFRLGDADDGVVAPVGNTWGTYLHGVFDGAPFRRTWLNAVRARKGLAPLPRGISQAIDSAASDAVQRFADHVVAHVDLEPVCAALGLRAAANTDEG